MDFEQIPVRSPYEFTVQRRGKDATALADEIVEVAVPKIRSERAPVVAQLEAGDLAIGRVDYRLIDGDLFRPYLNHWLPNVAWTRKTCRETVPKMLMQNDGCWASGVWISAVPNPFRGYEKEVADSVRERGRRINPVGRFDAIERAKSNAETGLCFVDGILYQSTRAPAWSVDGEGRLIACMPDYDDFGQFALIDARYSQDHILERYQKLRPLGLRSLKVLEPALLPNTSGVDSVGSFCRYVLENASAAETPALRGYVAELVDLSEDDLYYGPLPEKVMAALDRMCAKGVANPFADETRLTYEFLNVFPSPGDTPEYDDPYAEGGSPPGLH